MNIKLPNNLFGQIVMLTLIVLVGAIPFVVTLWLAAKIAPMWVTIPVAVGASVLSLLSTVRFRG